MFAIRLAITDVLSGGKHGYRVSVAGRVDTGDVANRFLLSFATDGQAQVASRLLLAGGRGLPLNMEIKDPAFEHLSTSDFELWRGRRHKGGSRSPSTFGCPRLETDSLIFPVVRPTTAFIVPEAALSSCSRPLSSARLVIC